MSRSKSSSIVLAVFVCVALLGACAARGDEEAGPEEEGTEETAEEPGGEAGEVANGFGDLPSPCGDGDYTVEPSEAGAGTDKLYLGVANDRTSTVRQGVNRELWDASQAFAGWCNEQGGIGGLEIELVDIDGKVLEVEPAMVEACASVFMLVGGGHIQDNDQFTGRAESDFHMCGLADVPGIAVSPQKAGSNGQVQPLPNPGDTTSTLQMRGLKEVHPDDADRIAVIWGNFPSMETIRNQAIAAAEAEGIEVVDDIPYAVTGESDWTPFAQQVINSGANSFYFVGEPGNAAAVVATLRQQGWTGTPVFETNIYDRIYAESAEPGSLGGSFIRSAFHPFEEADKWPAVRQYLDILSQYAEDPKDNAMLGMQAFSAWLLFATAANECAAANDGVLARDCVLGAASDIDDWTAGGLHSASDPGVEGSGRPACELYLDIDESGAFVRVFPEVGSGDDDGNGFWCQEGALVDVPANADLGVVDPDRGT